MKKTITIRLLEKTRNRLKIRAAKEKKTMMQLIDELSKLSLVK